MVSAAIAGSAASSDTWQPVSAESVVVMWFMTAPSLTRTLRRRAVDRGPLELHNRLDGVADPLRQLQVLRPATLVTPARQRLVVDAPAVGQLVLAEHLALHRRGEI